jgi:hypothetical protein
MDRPLRVNRVSSPELVVQVCLHSTMERVRNKDRQGGAVTPSHLDHFAAIGDAHLPTDDLAHDVEHHPAGIGVHPFAQAVDRSHGEGGLLPRFPNRGLTLRLAEFHLPCGELPGKPALLHAPTD